MAIKSLCGVLLCVTVVLRLAIAGAAEPPVQPSARLGNGHIEGDANAEALAGAVDENGLTIAPTTLPDYRARRVWQPKAPPAGTAVMPYRCRLVSYADKWTRHGLSNYMSWRWPNGPLVERKGKQESLAIFRDFDVDGDGKSSNDFVASLPFSLSQPLSNPEWPMHLAFPEIINHRFYGGASWYLARTEPGQHRVWIEQGYNPDHSPPWFDDRAEDHPLQGQANERNAESGLKLYWAIVWRKEDFLNGGDQYRVTFDDASQLAAITVRSYWLGYDDVRMIVQDGETLWISGTQQFDIPGAKGYGAGRNGRVFVCHPTKATWAEYRPQGHLIHFEPEKAKFVQHEFTDVRAVGWYLAKSRLDTGTQAHCKWYGFEADAVVNRPEQPSVNLDMVRVPGNKEVPDFFMATCEFPYAKWKQVHRWGNAPFNTLQERYVYDKFGQMGSMAYGDFVHGPDEPVTGVRFYDALAMCNTLSEYEGKTPCYWLDPEFKTPFKNQFLYTRAKTPEDWKPGPGEKRARPNPVYEPIVPPKVYVKWDADGHRLPTAAEWQLAFAANGERTPRETGEVAWTAGNSGKRTHNVGSKRAGALALYDMLGNVWELVWPYGDCFDPAVNQVLQVMGGDFQYPSDPTSAECAASPYGDLPWQGNGNIGLRTVCRQSGLAKPAGDSGANSAEAANRSIVWQIRRGETTKARHQPAMVEKPVLELARIPGGTMPLAISDGEQIEVTISPFEMAITSTTYHQWREVQCWAKAKGYTFSYDGDMGSMYWYRFAHSPQEPVVHLSGHDMMVWCNALSEMEGRMPCYYADEAMTQVYRRAYAERPIRMSGETAIDDHKRPDYLGRSGYASPYFFCRWDTDGYRLPTLAERQFAATEGGKRGAPRDPADWNDVSWSIFNSGGRTHAVREKQPNAFGLYDMWGNVTEWLWSGKPGADKRRPAALDRMNPKYNSYWMWDYKDIGGYPRGDGIIAGSSFLHVQGSYATDFSRYYPDLGFRVVCCAKDTHPRDGLEPLKSWPKVITLGEDGARASALWRGNRGRTGEFATNGVTRSPRIAWKFDTKGPVKSSPVVHDGVVYVGSEGGQFYALSAKTGEPLWSCAVENGVTSSACVANGVVYFGGNDGNLYALDAKTGKLRWKTLGRHALTSSPVVDFGLVFMEGPIAFDADTGKRAWGVKGARLTGRDDNRLSSVAIHKKTLIQNIGICDIEEARFIVGSGDSWIGENTEAVTEDGTIYYAASGTGGGIGSLGGGGGAIAVLNPATLKPRWVRQTEVASEATAKREILLCSPAVHDDKVYIGTEHGELLALDAKTGRDAWRFRAGGAIRSSPGVSTRDTTVYFGCDNGRLYAIDARSGEKRWELSTGGKVQSSPCPAEGAVFVGSHDGHVYGIVGP